MDLRDRRTKHDLWPIWCRMLNRCSNQNSPDFPSYGGRGIKICLRWKNDFWAFVNDMGPRPKNHIIERINNNGDYEPNNCCWATNAEQQRNKRNNILVTINNETRTLAEWSRKFKISNETVYSRLNRGWAITESLMMPVKKHYRNRRAK
jgi:hypothetical protein